MQMIIEKKYHYFYKTINKINNKFYYGIRSININPSKDLYPGSGVLLKKAIEKYGRQSFEKIVLKIFQTREEVSEYEKKIITEELVADTNCYNVKTGGDNEFIFHCSKETRKKRSESHRGLPKSEQFMANIGFKNPKLQELRLLPKSEEFKKKVSDKLKGRIVSETTRAKMSTAFTGRVYSEEQNLQKSIRMKEYYSIHTNSRKGKKHSDDSKLLMSQKNKNKKKCLVDGVIFDSIKATANHYNLSVNSTKDRIKSPRKKWENWNFYGSEV